MHYNRNFLLLADNYIELTINNSLSCIICRKWQLKIEERLEAYLLREFFLGQPTCAITNHAGDFL